MAYQLGTFADIGLDNALLAMVLDEHRTTTKPAFERLWAYYRNPLKPVGASALTWPGAGEASGRGWYRQAQEMGLPGRLVGRPGMRTDDRAQARREVVVENDIAWRVHAMVDFMFGKPVALLSTARDETLRRVIGRVLDAVWERSGGIALLQDMALLGHVYGHVDLLLRADESALPAVAPREIDDDAIERMAGAFRVEVIEPTRGVPIVDPGDYRRLAAYVIAFDREMNEVEDRGAESGLGSLWRRAFENGTSRGGSAGGARRKRTAVTEILSGRCVQVYEGDELVEERDNALNRGAVPVVHIQNMAQPFRYEGLGEVEPLVPLQDELNTRLSDRASRVTMQSFKMYLAKGIENFDAMHVGPGMLISTENLGAQIQTFGGDGESPSEAAHIQEIRDAMDKVSSVPPLAGGVVQGKIGSLTSANALRVTLMGLLAKTSRKRVTYGRGIAEMSRLILNALDAAGTLPTGELDRGVGVEWPDPLPADAREQVQAAEAKTKLGVPAERVLAELGYSASDPGVQ